VEVPARTAGAEDGQEARSAATPDVACSPAVRSLTRVLLLDEHLAVVAASNGVAEAVGLTAIELVGRQCAVLGGATTSAPGVTTRIGVPMAMPISVDGVLGEFPALLVPVRAANGVAFWCASIIGTPADEASCSARPLEPDYYESARAGPDVVLELDTTGVVRFASDGIERMTGYAASQFAGKSFVDLVPPEYHASWIECTRAHFEGPSRTVRTEWEILRSDGGHVMVEMFSAAVRDNSGAVLGVHGILRDVSARRLLEERLRQHQKMEAIGTLAGGIAHDFNNLLCAILGNLQLARAALGDGEAARRVQAAERAAGRASGITAQLLSYARKTPPGVEPVDVGELVDDVVEMLRRTIDPRITIDTIPPSETVVIHANPGQLNQVLMNLCLNSRDALSDSLESATGEGRAPLPRIIVTVEDIEVGPDDASLVPEAAPGHYARVTVSDNGVGMPPEVLERALEPFFTTKGDEAGTGLGLASVYSIVRAHGGFLLLDSVSGRGTVAQVYLPCEHVLPLAASPQEEPTAYLARGSETVLVADDDDMIREVIVEALTQAGYEVLLAEDGRQAVQLFEAHRPNVSLVILDLMMPGLSGPDAMARILDLDSSAKILLMSGYAALDTCTQVAHSGASGFLRKPFPIDELTRAVRRLLDE